MSRRATRIVKLTAEWIEKSRATEEREDWHDETLPGLVLRVSPAGSKVFYWVGRIGTRQTRRKIGPFPTLSVAAARIAAKAIAADAAIGKEPRPRSEQKEMTLQQLHDWYMENHSRPHKRTFKADERRYEERLAKWSNRKLSRITTQDVMAMHVAIGATSGHYAANKMLELLGHMYRLGRKILKFEAHDPTAGVTRFATHDRDRFLDADELPRFLAALEEHPKETTRDFIKLCLFTGARRSNLESMRWDEINLQARKWVIPGAKAKSGKPMTIALPEIAMEILLRRRASVTGSWVFPGSGATGHIVEPKHAMEWVLTKAGLENVRLHDLRRTLGSWMAASGTSLHIIGKTLGHSSTKTTAIYARLNLDPVRDAVESAVKAMQPKKE